MTNKKNNLGGKRPGAGPPTKREGVKRVSISVRLDPMTIEAIRKEKIRLGISIGEIIDRLFDKI